MIIYKRMYQIYSSFKSEEYTKKSTYYAIILLSSISDREVQNRRKMWME